MDKFCQSADKADTTSQKAKTLSKKGGGSSTGHGGQRESKSSATFVTEPGAGKGSKRTRKEDGLPERQRWLNSYKLPKLPALDTSVISKAQTPRKSDKRKWPKKKAATKGSNSTPGEGSNPKAKTGGGPPTFKPLPLSRQPLDHWVNHRQGNDVIPSHAERVEWDGGLVLVHGTRDNPLVSFEAEQQAHRQAGPQIRLWRVELINHER